MKTIKKLLLAGCLIACAAAAGGAAFWTPVSDYKTAQAEETQSYTTQDVFFMARVTNVYAPNGNFNLTISLSDYDTKMAQANYAFEKDLATAFNELGFFDKVKIGEKTLRQLGCTSFWDNAMDINVNEPKNVINLHCHADPETWQAAVNSGEVAFSAPSCPVTIEEGMLFPSLGYLTGEVAPIVYRAANTIVSIPKAGIAYDMENYVQAEVDSLLYTTEWDENYNNAYLGISFVGDDYLGNGEQVERNGNYFKGFDKDILVNGESGKVENYGLYNLGEAGKGHFSFVIRVPETDCVSITIPEGTLFPTRVMDTFYAVNGNPVYFYYQTKEEVTFYKSTSGAFVSLEKLREEKITALQTLRASKVDEDYFSADVAEMDRLVTETVAAIANSTDVETIQASFDYVKILLEGMQPKADAVNAAKAELDAYKADEIYFTDADSATRVSIIETAKTAIDAAESSAAISEIVASAKANVDEIPSKGKMVAEKLAELNGYKAEEGYYREAEVTQRAEIIESAKTDMDGATSATEIDEIVASAKAAIDDLKTNAEYTAEEDEIAANKAAALAIVNEAKAAIDLTWYSETDATTINVLYTQTKEKIENATTKEEMDAATQGFVDKLATLTPMLEEEDEKSDGCGGAIGSAGAALAILSIFGCAVACKKKEN